MSMIEIDRTDEEREELVKQWIKDYWLAVVGAVALAIAMVYGLHYFRQSKIDALSGVAQETEQAISAISTNRVDIATEKVKSLQSTQADTSFSVVATLELAKKHFDEGKFTAAVAQYDWLIGNAGDSAIRDIARLRKARAQANAKQYGQAIDTLGGLESQNYLFEASLLKGDIYMANHQFDDAQKAYKSIQGEAALSPEVIQQRLDLLSIKQQKVQ